MSNIRQMYKTDSNIINGLLNRAFGPGRFARSVYRLREKSGYHTEFSYVYELKGKIVASISYSVTSINNEIQGLLLGPLAVEPQYKGKGYGVALVEKSIKAIIADSNYDFILVVGDYDYYERFGFKKTKEPFNFYGPVNKSKVLTLDINQKLEVSNYTIMEFK